MVDFKRVKGVVYAIVILSQLAWTSSVSHSTNEGIGMSNNGSDRAECSAFIAIWKDLNHTLRQRELNCKSKPECKGFVCSTKITDCGDKPTSCRAENMTFGVEINRDGSPVEVKLYLKLGNKPHLDRKMYRSEKVPLSAVHLLDRYRAGFLAVNRAIFLHNDCKYLRLSVTLCMNRANRSSLCLQLIRPSTPIPITGGGCDCKVHAHKVLSPPIKHFFNHLCAKAYPQIEEYVVGRHDVHEFQFTAEARWSDSCVPKFKFRAAETNDVLVLQVAPAVEPRYTCAWLRIFDDERVLSHHDWRYPYESSGPNMAVEYHQLYRRQGSANFQFTITTKEWTLPEQKCPPGYNYCPSVDACVSERTWCRMLQVCGMDCAFNQQRCKQILKVIEEEKKDEARAPVLRYAIVGISVACSVALSALCATSFGILFCRRTLRMPAPPDPHAIWRGGRWEEIMNKRNQSLQPKVPQTDGDVELAFIDPTQIKPDILTEAVEKETVET